MRKLAILIFTLSFSPVSAQQITYNHQDLNCDWLAAVHKRQLLDPPEPTTGSQKNLRGIAKFLAGSLEVVNGMLGSDAPEPLKLPPEHDQIAFTHLTEDLALAMRRKGCVRHFGQLDDDRDAGKISEQLHKPTSRLDY